ncbi:SMP-30/gluconolactonase/LRE family protein [Streptomyces nojiriensis]|uniref:SMP-30/gluconolactonase/LRE family protein n=1 Tax=Streptomyces nojiriensis TaxID=66374 RepID=UPI0036A38559
MNDTTMFTQQGRHDTQAWELVRELGATYHESPPDRLQFRYPWSATLTSRNTCIVIDRSLPLNRVTEFDADGREIWSREAPPRLNVCLEFGPHTRLMVEGRTIRVLDTTTGKEETWSAILPEVPNAGCLTPDGDVVVGCDGGLYRLSRTGEVSLLVASSDDTFLEPQDVHVGPDHTILVTDGTASCVVLLDRNGVRQGILGTWHRPGRGQDELLAPNGACIADDGWIYVAETRRHRIVEYAPDGTRVRDVPISGPEPHSPATVRPLPGGDLLVVDSGNHRVFRCDRDGRVLWTLGESPYRSRLFSFPRTVDYTSGSYLVCDAFNDRVIKVASDGMPQAAYGDGGELGTGLGLSVPRAASQSAAGDLCVADGLNSRVLVIDAAGRLLREITEVLSPTRGRMRLGDPHQAEMIHDGLLHVVDSDLNAVLWIDADNNVRREWFGTPDGLAFSDPHQAHYVNGTLYVADSANDRVVVIDVRSDGGSAAVGEPQITKLSYPRCIRPLYDELVAVDSDANRLVWTGKDGSTADVGPILRLGHDLPAVNPELRRPKWVTAVDGDTIAVADMFNSRITIVRRPRRNQSLEGMR